MESVKKLAYTTSMISMACNFALHPRIRGSISRMFCKRLLWGNFINVNEIICDEIILSTKDEE